MTVFEEAPQGCVKRISDGEGVHVRPATAFKFSPRDSGPVERKALRIRYRDHRSDRAVGGDLCTRDFEHQTWADEGDGCRLLVVRMPGLDQLFPRLDRNEKAVRRSWRDLCGRLRR